MKFITNLSFIVAIFFFSCNDEETGEKLTGTIRGLGGNPVSGAVITLKNSGNSTTSDASGAFEMNLYEDLLINVYKSSGDSVIDTLSIKKQLLEAGAHFGHQTSRWHPRMKDYIFTQRNHIHIIDLE